ncbi:uncharacterized protein [Antedon mediterranea]|uniref:uncharacterized protein n=1 Tax=Antedon mediterranea TaxID=105859 RepID=UPI003AF64B34
MYSQGNQKFQFQPTAQQSTFETSNKVGLDNSQSMLSLLNEDEFSQQQQQQQQQVNCQPLSYYSNQISVNNYGSLPTQVQRNYMQYAQQSQAIGPSPYNTTNTNYQMQQGYQRSDSYQTAYANQHATSYYPNAQMTNPYQSYNNTQGYPIQGRSPASSPSMLPTVTAVGPKYPQIPQNSVSPVMGQGSTMYSPGNTPVNNRSQFQFPTSPVHHPTRPSPIQSPSAPKRSPAAMACPSPIQSHSPAPVASTNSASPLPVRSPQNNSPSFNKNRPHAKQKQEMVDLSSMSKMYQPPTRTVDSDKKHKYSSPKRGGPIPKMEEMVAFIGEPIMKEVLTSEKDGKAMSFDTATGDKLPNGKCDGAENGTSLNGSLNEHKSDNDKNVLKNTDVIDGIYENGEDSKNESEQAIKPVVNEKKEIINENKQLEEKNLEVNESTKTNNRKRKAANQPSEVPTNEKPKEKTKRTKQRSGAKASATENSPTDPKPKSRRSRNKSGKSKDNSKNGNKSFENGVGLEEDDNHTFSDEDDIDLHHSVNRPIKTYSKKNYSKDKDEMDHSKDSKSDFDEIMKTVQTKDIVQKRDVSKTEDSFETKDSPRNKDVAQTTNISPKMDVSQAISKDIHQTMNVSRTRDVHQTMNVVSEIEKTRDTVKNSVELNQNVEKNVQSESLKVSDIRCKEVEVVVKKVDTNVDRIDEKKYPSIMECLKTPTETLEIKNPMLAPSLKRQIADGDSHDTCESDQTTPSFRKRGRPFGSKNKQKRLTKKEKALLESEGLNKEAIAKKVSIKPTSLNQKLAMPLPQTVSQKPVGPVLRMVGAPDKPVSSLIVNQPNAVDTTLTKKAKHVDLSKRIHRPTSGAAVGSTYCDAGRPWLCALCGKPANVSGLGDLYGPYYPEGFKPPKRCAQEEQNKSNSGKQTSKAKISKVSSKSSNSKNSQRRKSSTDKDPETTPEQTSKNNSKSKTLPLSKLKTSKSVKPPSKNASTPSSSGNRRTSSTDTESSSILDEIWVHEECAVWAQGVYLVGGNIYGLHEAVKAACQMSCSHCKQIGATLGCFSKACTWTSHFMCSVNAGCLLREENYSMLCSKHKNKMVKMKDDT